MILIKSIHQDISTFMVAEWLLYFGQKFLVIKDEDHISSVRYSSKDHFALRTVTGLEIELSEVSSYWYRRGKWSFDFIQVKSKNVPELFKSALRDEWHSLYTLLIQNLKSKNSIGSDLDNEPNKLHVLELAKKLGLSIPKSLVTSNKADVLEYFTGASVINKTIADIILTEVDGVAYTNRTVEIEPSSLPDVFFPSLFQERIDKRYELRVFVLKGKCYTMAIFSQTDEQTKLDFRNYNYRRPNRNVPFALPEIIENKLLQLMDRLGLSTGSIDLIVNQNLEYLFLEVNPDGQFGMVSSPCNYGLEKIIASQLIS